MNNAVPIDRKEALRYLGFRNTAPDPQTEALLEESIAEIQKTAVPRITWKRIPLDTGDGQVSFAGIVTDSRSLTRNLAGCTEILILGATLGVGVDRLIERTLKFRISKAVVLQAAAAAAIEGFLDEWQEQIRSEIGEEGLFLRPRFSPGYGDFPLEFQPDFIRILEAPKKIGLTCTDSLLLAPIKSVTAVIGLSPVDTHCVRSGCESCGKANCAYRRNS